MTPLGNFICHDEGFLHLVELHRVGLGFHAGNEDGFLAGQIARGLQRVNAHVHQRPAARQGALEPPLRRVTHAETEPGVDDFQIAEDFFARRA